MTYLNDIGLCEPEPLESTMTRLLRVAAQRHKIALQEIAMIQCDPSDMQGIPTIKGKL